jgi:hypothetical protein
VTGTPRNIAYRVEEERQRIQIHCLMDATRPFEGAPLPLRRPVDQVEEELLFDPNKYSKCIIPGSIESHHQNRRGDS